MVGEIRWLKQAESSVVGIRYVEMRLKSEWKLAQILQAPVPPELLIARHVGMRALVSNIGEDNIDVAHRHDRLHDEVLESGSDAADK